jgi:NAD+--asparagine ADP-ribosyltransferase
LDDELAEYKGTTNAAGQPDAEAANAYLRSFEEELLEELDFFKKKMDKKGSRASDRLKGKYFEAKARYEYVSEQLGPDSPFKAAARAVVEKARLEAAL